MVAGLLFGLTAVCGLARVTIPADSVDAVIGTSAAADDGIEVGDDLPLPPGIRPGDVVTHVNGEPTVSLPRAPSRVGDDRVYRVRRDGHLADVTVTLGRFPVGSALTQHWPTLLLVGGVTVVAVWVFWRRPEERAAQALLLVAAFASCAATARLFGLQVVDVLGPGWWIYLVGVVAYALLWAGLWHFALMFPEPRPLLVRRPALLGLVYALPLALHGAYLLVTLPATTTPVERLGLVGSTTELAGYVFPLLVVVTWVQAYRHASDPTARQQLRWVTAWFVVVIIPYLALWKVPMAVLGSSLVEPSLRSLVFLPFPVALAVAVLRYRVFDIEIVVRRSLVYAALTVSVLAIYAATVGVLSRVFQQRNVLASLVATGLVAVLFSPLRDRLQRGVSRMVYGERDDPHALVSRLGSRLEATVAPEETLPDVVETVGRALRLPYTAIELLQPHGLEVVASWGVAGDEPFELPITYRGQALGRLLVGRRTPREPFGAADRRLLEALARQLGMTAHSLRLSRDLQHSREQIVTAREEERRRLRHDLHDGLGPTLAATALQLGVARRLIRVDPEAAEALVAGVREHTQKAVSDIRRIVDDLRPAALDQLGLVSALRERASAFSSVPASSTGEVAVKGLEVTVEAEGDCAGLPAAVEVAAFRIACEALTNVCRHANATVCVVRLVVSDGLQIEVVDDGCGLSPAVRPGVGMSSMRERAEELGGSCSIESVPEGGTVVRAHFPVLV